MNTPIASNNSETQPGSGFWVQKHSPIYLDQYIDNPFQILSPDALLMRLREAIDQRVDTEIVRMSAVQGVPRNLLRPSELLEIQWASERVAATSALRDASLSQDDKTMSASWSKLLLLGSAVPDALLTLVREARMRLGCAYVMANTIVLPKKPPKLDSGYMGAAQQYDPGLLRRGEPTTNNAASRLRNAITSRQVEDIALAWASAHVLCPAEIPLEDMEIGEAAFRQWGRSLRHADRESASP